MTRVVLVDDHRVVSRGVRSYLESFGDLSVVGIAANAEELFGRLDEWLPDVVVMDLLMPGGMDGLEAIRQVRTRWPKIQVVALTASTDDARLVGVLRAGGIGYVRKDAEPELLLATVRAAAQGRSMIDPAAVSVALQELAQNGGSNDALTERETEVLKQLAHGLTNREIADALFISEETVKTHVGNIFGKLRLTHRSQAVVYALKQGVISLNELKL